MTLNTDHEWLRRMAAIEEECGGMWAGDTPQNRLCDLIATYNQGKSDASNGKTYHDQYPNWPFETRLAYCRGRRAHQLEEAEQ